MIKLEIGDTVEDTNYHIRGVVTEVFDNWEDLKSKNHFVTIDPDDESGQMDNVEKIIKGDPKDAWLEAQKIRHSKRELNQIWYSVKDFCGGEGWHCEGRLKLIEKSKK